MAIKPDCKYRGTVAAGSSITVTKNGTIGYQVMLTCEDGATSFMIWLTTKNHDRAKRYFEILGVSEEKLRDPVYVDNGLAADIEGTEVSFGTKAETYNGKTSVKVQWIGRPTSDKLADDVAAFFGAKPAALPFKPIDDDVPF